MPLSREEIEKIAQELAGNAYFLSRIIFYLIKGT